jgi:hypothetical protein
VQSYENATFLNSRTGSIKRLAPGFELYRENQRNVICSSVGMSKLNQDKRDEVPDSKYAFPKERKEPLEDAAHVRNAIARFNQVEGVTDAERDAAWKRIRSAAEKFGVEVKESHWRELAHSGKAHDGKTRKAGS